MHRKLTEKEISEGFEFVGFMLMEDFPPKGYYIHLGNNFYGYKSFNLVQE